MLYVSLVASAVLLVLANRFVRRSAYPIPKTALLCFGFAFGPAFMMVFFPSLALQAGLLAALLLILLLVPQRGKRLYSPLSCIATVIPYAIFLFMAVQKEKGYSHLREEYPFESVETRLPVRPAREPISLTHPERLNNLESEISSQAGSSLYLNSRSAVLLRLHENSVDTFVDSAGFGVGRMMPRSEPSAELLSKSLQSTVPVPQPDYLMPFTPPAGLLTEKLPQWNPTNMGRMHDNGVIDFVNARNFGFVKDRQHVAGFQRHGMTKVPAAEASEWSVARVDLVGLVIHETPLAYVSANLPRMDELRDAPTRPLDAFETDALESLRNGEDVIARGNDDTARMLGAIRATKQCIACHGGSRGDLLGAFSYGLRREGK